MYLHMGQNRVVNGRDIVGIFDLDHASVSKITRDFLRRSEQSKKVVNVSPELPKSFVVTQNKKKKETVFITQLAAATLLKRGQSRRKPQ